MKQPKARPPHGIPCAIGGHPITKFEDMIAVDGSTICTDHAWAAGQAAQGRVDRPGHSIRRDTRLWSGVHAEADRKAAEDRMQATGGKQPGWVYYVEVGDLIKIGYSTDVRRRLRVYPPDATLLAVHPGTLDMETELHHRFGSCLARGREWFHPHRVLRDHVAGVVRQFGEPREFRVTVRHANR